jgi:hypothetical protein
MTKRCHERSFFSIPLSRLATQRKERLRERYGKSYFSDYMLLIMTMVKKLDLFRSIILCGYSRVQTNRGQSFCMLRSIEKHVRRIWIHSKLLSVDDMLCVDRTLACCVEPWSNVLTSRRGIDV